jgi:mannose-6-phosphate isomerase-like protein (cupin superfamily)
VTAGEKGPPGIRKVNLEASFGRFSDHWVPRIVGALNGQLVKIAKVQGAFDWHRHPEEDELFLVVRGHLDLHLRDGVVSLDPGELCIVPRGVEHRPEAREETWIVLFEPEGTLNTGDRRTDRTVDRLEAL